MSKKIVLADYIIQPSQINELLAKVAIQIKKQICFREWYLHKFGQILEQLFLNLASLKAEISFFPECPELIKVFDFIEANYHQPIKLPDVAKAVGYSPAYLTHLVHRRSGKTVIHWIVERRLKEAQLLLLETDQTITQIGLSIGYYDVRYFIRVFRKYYKTTPQEWRKAQRQP